MVRRMLRAAPSGTFPASETAACFSVSDWNSIVNKFGARSEVEGKGITKNSVTEHIVTPAFMFEEKYRDEEHQEMKLTSKSQLASVTVGSSIGWNCGMPEGNQTVASNHAPGNQGR
jgi:hypothetical protein